MTSERAKVHFLRSWRRMSKSTRSSAERSIHLLATLIQIKNSMGCVQAFEITEFVKAHPGGDMMLELSAGRDSTVMYESGEPARVTKQNFVFCWAGSQRRRDSTVALAGVSADDRTELGVPR